MIDKADVYNFHFVKINLFMHQIEINCNIRNMKV